MRTELIIPKLQMSSTHGTLVEWLEDDGTVLDVGQPIYVLETDKSVQEIEAPTAGKLVQKVPAGETYTIGTIIGEIVAI